MNTKTRYFLIYIFLFVLSLTSFAQDFSQADSLFKENKFLEASIEYARTSFYSKDVVLKQEASYRRALCYRYMGESNRALTELQRINLFRASSDFRVKVIYESVLNSFIIKDYNGVKLLVNKLRFYEKDYSKIKNVLPTYIMSLNALREWDSAKKEYLAYVNTLSVSQKVKDRYLLELDNIYAKKNIPKEYSAKTASNWSRFIPGAGHIYTGRITEGLFAFTMCAGFALSGAYMIYYQYYFTGYVLGIGLWYKSYMGGIRRSSYLANRKNIESLNQFNKKCVNLFIDMNAH